MARWNLMTIVVLLKEWRSSVQNKDPNYTEKHIDVQNRGNMGVFP
jgi:hypothetical protein